MALADIAAGMPWPVFACGSDKRPVVATGFKAATRDAATIQAQFAKPGAAMIGVPTGQVSGIVVIDIDIKSGKDGRGWLQDNADALPPTRTHKTQSGGLHLLFTVPPGVTIRNSASKLALGVDVRGDGGYVIVPPSPAYVVADNAPPAEMPRWLIRLLTEPEVAPAPPPRPDTRHEKYVQAAIDREVLAVSRAGEGTRNDTLNRAAFALGTLVGAGQVSRGDAEAELQRAGQAAGLPAREAATTVKSGLDAGIQSPRAMPERIERHAEIEDPPPEITDPDYWRSIEAEADAATREPADIPEAGKRKPDPFPATALTADELENIPPRELVYGHFLFRKFISAIGAPGGAGKTAYAFAVALSVAANKPLLGEKVHDPGSVWIYNLEDPRVELRRRIKAALIGHDLSWSDVAGRLFIDSGRDRPLVIAKATGDGDLIAWPQVPDLIAEIKARDIRLLIVDPFVRSHRVKENFNDQIDFVAALWASIADAADCAILLVHHFNKGGVPGEASAFRGASALIDASRAAVTLGTMPTDDAKLMDIAEKDRWQYVRADNAKLNLAPPPDGATWLRLVGTDLHNATETRESDSVQTVRRWHPRRVSVARNLSGAEINDILDVIQAGPEPGLYFTATKRGGSGRWAGAILVNRHGFDDGQAQALIGAWIKSELLIEANYMHPKWRRLVPGVQVDNTRRPT